ncbi:RND family efflux transporter MFP subunit [Roseibium hamelinense]|uniref:RND family efflux transporter MFP subunit n=1 Tax=Roseibium hamelinense TaxID=150831 RepID=A0A562SUA5_9HYPH|nr:HlyD family efflux transporter periplasmic adaptor subunit [Roseibium hamelinense]MTI42728.1 HlyD family efflux transporter periplasmic adaptor subunit [Roseibium hamelinense]TWI84608.1 RND family efflux transporter MFP subunit [Roseibium hamelinense]
MLQSVNRPGEDQSVPSEYREILRPGRRSHRFWMVAKAVLQAVIALIVLFAAVQGMNTLIATKPDVPKRAVQEKAYTVESRRVALTDHAPVISVYGEVTAGRTVDLRALVGGEVVEVNPSLKAGGLVSEGEVLVAIDRFDYEGALTEAQASLAEAEAQQVQNRGRVALEEANIERSTEQLEFAKRDLERAQSLLERGAVTEQTVDERKLLVSQRQQTLEQRQNTLALEEARVVQQYATIKRLKWGVQNAERQLANTVLKAPFDAVIREEAAQPGRLISVNDVVASIYSRDELEVRFTLSDNQYGRIVADAGTVVGREVEVIWNLGNEPLVYQATVERVGADVASTRGGVDVFAVIEYDPEQTPLRPGAFVEVLVADRTYASTAVIPETSVYGDGLVYVIEEGRLSPRQTRPLAFDGDEIIVRGGLESGDVILTTRVPEAGEGLLVVPLDPSENPDAFVRSSDAAADTAQAAVKN